MNDNLEEWYAKISKKYSDEELLKLLKASQKKVLDYLTISPEKKRLSSRLHAEEIWEILEDRILFMKKKVKK